MRKEQGLYLWRAIRDWSWSRGVVDDCSAVCFSVSLLIGSRRLTGYLLGTMLNWHLLSFEARWFPSSSLRLRSGLWFPTGSVSINLLDVNNTESDRQATAPTT